MDTVGTGGLVVGGSRGVFALVEGSGGLKMFEIKDSSGFCFSFADVDAGVDAGVDDVGRS